MPRSAPLYRRTAQLQALLRELPARPGIYRFYDSTGAVVYVGKSVSLRDRVRSYFTGRAATGKLQRMRQEITALDWEETGSELEALLLESRLIKQLQPRFNILLREFVPLPYVRIDLQDPFPRLEVTRAPRRDGARYFGPFRSQRVLEAAVAALTDALQLRNCPEPGAKLARPRACYRLELGLCSGPCVGAVAPEAYRAAADQACAVLEGRQEAGLRLLAERMERAAERLQFERAARFRDAIRHLRALGGRQQALFSAVGRLSLVAACPARVGERLCFFVFAGGRLVLQETLPQTELRSAHTRRLCAERLLRAAETAPLPADPALDPSLLDEVQIVTAWMSRETREGTWWEIPASGTEAERRAGLEAWLAAQATAPPAREAA